MVGVEPLSIVFALDYEWATIKAVEMEVGSFF
jgi:hypothetical protein